MRRPPAGWYRGRDGKSRWLDSHASVARIARIAGRKDRLRYSGLRNYLLFAGERAVASAIEARRAETQGGSVTDESAVANGETPTPGPAQPGDA